MIRTEADVTAAALAVMAQTTDPRLREIMTALVTHLHGFIRDVALTEPEFHAAVRILNTIGQQTNEAHNEAMLMAGALGASALVCLLNNTGGGKTETTQNQLGPFWRLGAPVTEDGGSILRSETPGPRMDVHFRVLDPEGAPVAGAEMDVWHASPVGLYEQQDETQAAFNLRGRFRTQADGSVRFRTVRPVGYPIPTDTTVGDLLRAQNRHPYRPAHVHALAFKDGFKTLISQVYVDETGILHSDVAFAATETLTAMPEPHDEPHPRDGDVGTWYSLDYTFTMEPGESRLPVPPIK